MDDVCEEKSIVKVAKSPTPLQKIQKLLTKLLINEV